MWTRDLLRITTLNDYLLQSSFIILNDGSDTRVSANINCTSCPDVTLVHSSLFNFSWKMYDDPIGSAHLPIKISINYGNPNSSYKFQHKRASLSLAQFDKKIFMKLISCCMDQFCTDSDGSQLYDKQYNIIDCILRAGGVIKDRGDSYRRFESNKNCSVSYYYKNVPRSQRKNKPWWDLECQEAVNLRKRFYRELFKNPNRTSLNNYRNVSH